MFFFKFALIIQSFITPESVEAETKDRLVLDGA